jgi:hypothetical protein
MRWLLVLAIAVVACDDHGAKRLQAVRDTVCACTTARYADEALASVAQWKIESNPRTQQIARDMMDCLKKIYANDRPQPGDDREAGEPGSASPHAVAP